MRESKALEIISGLSATQNERLKHYIRRLSTDRSSIVFDDKVRDMLIQYGREPEEVSSVVNHLDNVGFGSSKYEYAQLEEQLQRFERPNPQYRGYLKTHVTAKSRLAEEFSKARLRPLRYRNENDFAKFVSNRKAHAGFSYIFDGTRSKGDVLEDGAFWKYNEVVQTALEEGSFNRPILIAARTQGSGGFVDGKEVDWVKHKTRLVSMVDFHQVMAETVFAKPIQEFLSRVTWYAGGVSDDTIGFTVGRMRSKFDYYVSIDYSKFDQSIPDWLIHDAFDILRNAFGSTLTDSEERLFRVLRQDFINKCFVDGNGFIRSSRRGVPSGSMFTQIVDSVVNRLMVDTFLESIEVPFSDRDMCIMGDDNIIFTKQPLDIAKLTSYLKRVYDVEVNYDKSSQGTSSEDPEFLSRVWTSAGVYREPRELIAKMLYPESFRPYERVDVKPFHIIHSYSTAFPLGMNELIVADRFATEHSLENLFSGGDLRWVSGYARFRAIYG